MAETTTPAATPAKKGKAAGKSKKPKSVSTHPKVSDMVNTAITSLKERHGSSLSAIKKYIGSHYKVDLEKLSPFIRKYVKSAVASGSMVQVKGKGANGSFRMKSAAGPKEKTAAKPKSAAKKAAAPKKPKAAATPKKAAKAKPKKAAVKKTPKKPAVKKAKPAAKKVKPAKSPKAKKPKAAKKASPKKGRK